MDENATPHATDDADRSPFRRFPYGPALLCVGCLSMAVWTWMRYSYAWDLTAWAQERHRGDDGDWPQGAYSRLSGTVAGMGRTFREGHYSADSITLSQDGMKTGNVLVPRHNGFRKGMQVWMNGRADCLARKGWMVLSVIDARRSRFTGASIAGLVVAAMGVFVFGLYFRSWLRERRAAA